MTVTQLLVMSLLGFSPVEPVAAEPAHDLARLAHAHFQFNPAGAPQMNLGLLQDEPVSAPRLESEQAIRPFGEAESRYWSLHAGAGGNFRNHNLAQAGVGVGYFIADGLSIDAEFNVLYFDQTGENAAGANVNLLLRWHFFPGDIRDWSLYADGGAGLLLTTSDVPHTSSSFNFTPQLGVGASFDIGQSRRLFTGVRWHHVSNANLYKENPGRDGLLFYAMLSFPF